MTISSRAALVLPSLRACVRAGVVVLCNESFAKRRWPEVHETDINVTDSHGSDFMGSGDIARTKHPPRDNHNSVIQPARSVGRSVVSELSLGAIPQVIHCNLDQLTTSALKPISSVEHRAHYVGQSATATNTSFAEAESRPFPVSENAAVAPPLL